MTSSDSSPPSPRTPMMSVEALRLRFQTACTALPALGPGRRICLGCSAGGDSMALLDLARHGAKSAGWSLHVLHFDHAQRADSRKEANFVARRCETLGLPFHTEKMEVSEHGSLLDEGSLREARYAFFARSMQRLGGEALMLAHHADDRAETLLMRLMRGSGPTGLASIRAAETVHGMTLVRPLLTFRRAELRAYLEERGLDWIEDPSNLDERFKRAWVRNELLPLLNERMGMDITARLLRASSLIEDEAGALRGACRLMLEQMRIANPPGALGALSLEHPFWKGAASELRRALLRHWLWDLRRGGHPPGFDAVQEALKFVERGSPGGRLRTVERIHLAREAGTLVAYPDPDG